MKNLVIVHMESLNKLNFTLNRQNFDFLKSFIDECKSYEKYFSTATSTYMAITDLMFGDTSLFESATNLQDIFKIHISEKSLFDILFEYGYQTYHFNMELDYIYDEIKELDQLINRNGEFWFGDNEEEFQMQCEKAFESERFALFVNDASSCITYDGQREKLYNNSVIERQYGRFKRIDKTIERIVDSLTRKEKIDDTVIVMYGDHGEEFWTRELYEGYTHAIPPYLDIIHCPLIIYNAKDRGVYEQLLGTSNLKKLILAEIGMDQQYTTPQYVISRNLFAQQAVNAKMLNKSYGITDGEYLLIISQKGEEMFINSMDMTSNGNILEFFKKKKNTIQYDSKFNVLKSWHYDIFFTELCKKEIIFKYEELHSALINYIINLKPVEMNVDIGIYRNKGKKIASSTYWMRIIKKKYLCYKHQLRLLLEKCHVI